MKKKKSNKNKKQKKLEQENLREKFFWIAKIPKEEQDKFYVIKI